MKSLLLTQKQFDEIKEIALFTGSRAFNALVSEKSDWDYVLTVSDILPIVPSITTNAIYKMYGTEQYTEDTSVYISIRAVVPKIEADINLIIVHRKELFDAWAFATRSFIFNKKRINKLFPTVKEKRKKHLFFQKIKNEYLNEVTQRGK